MVDPDKNSGIPAILISSVVALALSLHLAQAYVGRLELSDRAGEYGRANFDTGSTNYPREVNDAEGYALKLARPVHRAGSQYWSIDEYLYSIVPPREVVSVSQSAYDRTYSNVYRWAEEFHPAISSDPEVVLRVDPDLFLVSSSGRTDFTEILKRAGLPVFRTYTSFTKLEEVRRTILLLGYLTGRDAEAAGVAREFDQAITRAQRRKSAGAPAPRILGYSGKYSYGGETLFNDVVRAAGGINVAAEHGVQGYEAVNAEGILRWNPDWIVSGAARGNSAAVLSRLLEDPAISLTTAAKKGQVLVFENNIFLPMSPFTALFLDALGEALYSPKTEVARD